MRDSPSAKVLYRQLFAPIAEFNQKSQIVIVPDDQLGFIPFDALTDAEGNYALRRHIITCVPSATILALLRSTRQLSGPATLLAVGSSNGADSKSRSFGRAAYGLFDPEHAPTIGSLPSVDTEVQNVAGIFGTGSEVLLGQNASELAFKSQRLDQYRFIHIASHGFADLKFPDRSGLFLGFDHDTRDDGLLQIREIRDLRLRADLVTLSACVAGAGKLEGENGIASVVQAFLFAGARSVVASLWTADDTFTTALMTRL